ncbi:60S ribosomal protein L19-1-like [Hibiscus syriacus]|uniref:phospholipase D n=1 Tax=Hibiscus syriacus TaxID=106335 RepID=A0A6A3CUR6_HIBSY|nr:60S ribosomal protein L19-1-like [Hibiscus syriacus]
MRIVVVIQASDRIPFLLYHLYKIFLYFCLKRLIAVHFQNQTSRTLLLPGSKLIDPEWWETQERGDQVDATDETGQAGPRTSCRLAGDEIIKNRVLEVLYRRILRAHSENKCFRVIIIIPLLPGFQGGLDDAGAASVRAIMHWQYRTICRGHNSILHNLYDHIGHKTHDYISFYGLRSYGELFDGGPVATSPIYAHNKIMLIDDSAAIIGSANINDRSLLGSRDSEIGVLIEDKELVDSRMGGKPWKAGKFVLSLRLSLWSEHLGLRKGEVNKIIDPICDSSYKDIWAATAMLNTNIYQEVFS